MTAFESKGVDIQTSCRNKFQAEKCFEHSCELCCNKGLRIRCDSCAIKCAHERVIGAFAERKVVGFISMLN